MTTPPANRQQLLDRARRPEELATLAFAGVIGRALAARPPPLIRGLSEARFEKLLNEYFLLETRFPNGEDKPGVDADDEYADLVKMLLEYRGEPTEQDAWLAYAVASATMGENHLWQDMGLPNRQALSDLLQERFPALAAMNYNDMKWKKFLYRQLCERTGVSLCKSPHCAECRDYAECFAAED